MDMNKLTVKCQQALQEAQTKAVNFNHQEVDGEHLMLALLEQSDGLVPRLLERMEVPADTFREKIVQAIEKKPRISGPGTEPGKVHITQRLNKLLVKAQAEAKAQLDAALADANKQIADLAILATEQLLGRELAKKDEQERFVAEFLAQQNGS